MTVAELIEQLKECDQEKECKFYSFTLAKDSGRYVTIDEIAEGRFIEIISKENDQR